MKKHFLSSLISFASILLFINSSQLFAQAPKKEKPVVIDSAQAATYYVEMKGSIYRFVPAAEIGDKLPPLGGAALHIFIGTKEYTTTQSNDKGKCVFKLPLNQSFKIQVSKYGYVTKFFEVNTKVPDANKGTFTFNFDVDLFEENAKLDVSILKKPIAKLTFDVIYKRFQYDDAYTSRINFDIKKMYKAYDEIEKAKKDSIAKFNSPKNVEPAKPADDKKKDGTPGKKK